MNGGLPGKFDTRFVYKNLQTGKDEEMAKPPYTDTINWEIDTLKWKFVDTKQIVLDPGEQAPIHDFSITSVEGSEYTDDFLKHDSLHFFLVSYDLTKADRDVQPQINAFAQACEKNGIPFIGLSSSTPEAIDEFRHEVQAPYDYFITDATQLKTMIRSNPGLILLKGSKILDMWGKRTLPTFEDFRKKYPNNK
jgi:hypothetical protein